MAASNSWGLRASQWAYVPGKANPGLSFLHQTNDAFEA